MKAKTIEIKTIKHKEDKRKHIPTAEMESIVGEEIKTPIQIAYERRNRDLDPQLVWRGKDEQNWSDLIVPVPPLYIQEKVHPKVIIDDLQRDTKARKDEASPPMANLFADFNGLSDMEALTEFYQHDQNWSNRMIAGDSLMVMASLAEREGLRGRVQCIYFDPPYGIRFNSNFQWSTASRNVKDGVKDHITREPEQVKAFTDTWKDNIHSYLNYLRDRLTIARDLLHESGSIFVQIGDENVHRVRALMDEVFREENFCNQISIQRTSGAGITKVLGAVTDYIIWFAKNKESVKYRQLYHEKVFGEVGTAYVNYRNREDMSDCRLAEVEGTPSRENIFAFDNTTSTTASAATTFVQYVEGQSFQPKKGGWKTNAIGMKRLLRASRVKPVADRLSYRRYFNDFAAYPINNMWTDTSSSFNLKSYVVQTTPKVIQRCILMTTDPGDLVLDPTCGSGTTAYVAEQWGRRWITIDTSRVALALARSRLMGARYPYYLLADSVEGKRKEAQLAQVQPDLDQTHCNVRVGFVNERVPHITLKSITNNAEIGAIWEQYQPEMENCCATLNNALKGHNSPFQVMHGGRTGKTIDFLASGMEKLPSGEEAPRDAFLEWEIPRKAPSDWPKLAKTTLKKYWELKIARQQNIDASIAAKAEFAHLYDKPYVDRSKLRVAGPFTVDSLSPHRVLALDENDELIDLAKTGERNDDDFAQMILESLKIAGVQSAHKQDHIKFVGLTNWPGKLICADGLFLEGEKQRHAAVFIGPEFGTVSRPDLVAAAREAGEAGFDILIACAFNYDARSSEFDRLGRVPVLQARMNPELHMNKDIAGRGNLFVIFGEPDIKVESAGTDSSGAALVQIKVVGVDVFKPQTGEVVSEDTDRIALWMLDTDYNEESFFVRHAYFLGANDPYKSLKSSLKAEIDKEAWESLHSDTSRPFPTPESGRIAVKVINHLGDEVMKVFRVP